MNANQHPTRISVPFAVNGDRRDPAPHQSDVTQPSPQPAWDTGFTSVTSSPKAAGGIAPSRLDFNGIFYALSAASRFVQAGGLYPFDSSFSTTVGGYPKGAMLLSTDGVTVWQSTVDGNVTDPDGTSAAGWRLLAPRADVFRADLAAATGATPGALLVGVRDSGNFWNAADAENVLQEAGSRLRAIETRADFASGAFTPALTGAAQGGTVTLSGGWSRAGKAVSWSVVITCVGAGQWSASAGSTRITGLPFATLAAPAAFSAAYESGAFVGCGCVSSAGIINLPSIQTQFAVNGLVVLGGSFVIA